MIEHLNKPRLALTKIYDHLKPGGIFFMEIPSVNNFFSWLFNFFIFSKDKTHVFIPPLPKVENLMNSVGFRTITYYSTLLPKFFRIPALVRTFGNVLGVYQKPIRKKI